MSESKFNINIPENIKDIFEIQELDNAIETLLSQRTVLDDGRVITYTLEDAARMLKSKSESITASELMNQRDSKTNSFSYNQGA